MKVALIGPVTAADIDTAAVFGIEPTSFVTAGVAPKTKLPIERMKACEMIGDEDLRAANLISKTLVYADALIVRGAVPALATGFGMPIYQC